MFNAYKGKPNHDIKEINIIEGASNENKPNEYHTCDYGLIYRNTITNIISDKFGYRG
jgi:hypothetical protein